MKRYTFAGLAGCVTQHRSRRSGTLVSIYAAAQANLDASAGAWVTVCEEHHTLASHRTLALARHHLPSVEWCEACQLQLRQSSRTSIPRS
jgi:hypothetical protein